MNTFDKVMKQLAKSGMSEDKAGKLIMDLLEENSYSYVSYVVSLYKQSLKKHSSIVKK